MGNHCSLMQNKAKDKSNSFVMFLINQYHLISLMLTKTKKLQLKTQTFLYLSPIKKQVSAFWKVYRPTSERPMLKNLGWELVTKRSKSKNKIQKNGCLAWWLWDHVRENTVTQCGWFSISWLYDFKIRGNIEIFRLGLRKAAPYFFAVSVFSFLIRNFYLVFINKHNIIQVSLHHIITNCIN